MLTDTVRLSAGLWGNLRLDRGELAELQMRKLRALLRHAWENVPYYRELFASAGVKPEDVRRVEDLAAIPVTGKSTLRALPPHAIIARGADPAGLVEDMTSGSTGIPLRVRFTPRDHLVRSLVFVRTFMQGGYRPTDRQAIVCDTRFAPRGTRWFQRMGILRKRYIPVHLELDEQLRMLREYRPQHIHGYPLSLALIAGELERRGIRDIAPRVLHTGAELVGAGTRSLINGAFGVDMLDTYATIESGLIAWECRAHRGYHVNADCTVLEILAGDRPARPGEPGKTVVTNLHSWAMPIIRYELGDVCRPSDETCPCGSRLPLMGIVEGRVDDMVRTPAGRILSPNSITNALEAVEGISRFRVIQKRESLLQVLVVPGEGFSPATPSAVSLLLGELAGEGVEVDVRVVEDLPREASGKIRAVVSELGGVPSPARGEGP